MPTILKGNVQYAHAIAKPRSRKPYGYGGVWVRNDINRTTDCSGIVTHVLDASINGERMAWSRHGISTEAYRYCGGNERDPRRAGAKGPFGTIRVLRWQDIPSNAVVKIGLMHGPGGGANSHMACTLQGINIESRGGTVASGGGQWYGGNARGYNHSLFHDWFYLPGEIVGGGGTPDPVSPTAPGAVYLGQDCGRYTCMGDKVRKLQEVLNKNYEAYSNLDEDGEFGPATAAVVSEFQIRSALNPDGIAGPATLAALGISFPTQVVNPVMTDSQKLDKILENTTEIRKQLEVAGDPSWASKGHSVRDLIYKLAQKGGII